MIAVHSRETTKQSEYMNWAKTRSSARFNLATSGLENLKLKDLQFSADELELTGESGYGYPPLVDTIAGRFSVSRECVVTAAGTSFANHLAMAALVETGDEVLLESPIYEPLLALANYLGCEVRRFQRRFEDGFAINADEVERNLTSKTRLIVITNFHNPSGVLTKQETLKELRELARRRSIRVLVDEVYLEMLFAEAPQTSFHLGEEFIVTSSLTKAFGLSGLRCGWILAAPELAQKMWRLNDLFAATPVHIAERLSLAAFKQLPQIADKAKARLDYHRKLLNEFLDSREDLETIRPASGSIMFPRLKDGEGARFCDRLRDAYETSVVPGRFFEMPAHFRIGMGGDSEVFLQGLDRIGSALDDLR